MSNETLTANSQDAILSGVLALEGRELDFIVHHEVMGVPCRGMVFGSMVFEEAVPEYHHSRDVAHEALVYIVRIGLIAAWVRWFRLIVGEDHDVQRLFWSAGGKEVIAGDSALFGAAFAQPRTWCRAALLAVREANRAQKEGE